MHNCIERTLYTGHASYKLSLSTGFLDIWEPATLAIKRDGYSIKCSGPSGVVVAEKFSSSTIVSIPYGSPTEFSIIDSQGTERILRVVANSTDISGYPRLYDFKLIIDLGMIGWAYLESVCTWVQVGRDPNVEGVDLGVFVINRRAGAFCKFPPDLEVAMRSGASKEASVEGDRKCTAGLLLGTSPVCIESLAAYLPLGTKKATSRDTIVLTLRLFILKVQFLLDIILPEHMWDMCKILYTMCMLGNPLKQDLNLITDPLIFSKSSRTDEK
ncbi:UNVERIFIED_CONTAM: hypothetical protein Sangu_3122500 [Sesamum angustifolium]|uniref:DUF7046 domain-containing protein n=1 Tax=Sesamum angustifolium TaxID=2727405 RepID=A0AAW2K0R5_9LAMI